MFSRLKIRTITTLQACSLPRNTPAPTIRFPISIQSDPSCTSGNSTTNALSILSFIHEARPHEHQSPSVIRDATVFPTDCVSQLIPGDENPARPCVRIPLPHWLENRAKLCRILVHGSRAKARYTTNVVDSPKSHCMIPGTDVIQRRKVSHVFDVSLILYTGSASPSFFSRIRIRVNCRMRSLLPIPGLPGGVEGTGFAHKTSCFQGSEEGRLSFP